MTLNQEQLAAVTSPAKRTIVVAGPGSGKSRVLIERVAFLVRQVGIDPKQIVVMTFTNAGAHVLTERLRALGIVVGYIGTLHGWCFRLIQTHGHALGYRAGNVSIVTEEAQKSLLTATKKKLGSKVTDKALSLRESPEAKLVWNEYEHTLKRSNMVDYDRILFDAHRLLCTAAVREKMKIAAVLCDEWQDAASIDWDILDVMPAEWAFIVGDPDQSIYSFRGGSPELLTGAFEDDPPDDGETVGLLLTVNYRSDYTICDAANKLIRYNKERVDKAIYPIETAGMGYVPIESYPNGASEVHGCWQHIQAATVDAGEHAAPYTKNEIAVLARTNAIADQARETLRGLGVPIKNTGKVQLPADWAFTLATMSLMVDPSNDFHAERVLKELGEHQLAINEDRLKAVRDGLPISSVNKRLRAIVQNRSTKTLLETLLLWGVSADSRELVYQRWGLLDGADPTLADLLADLWRHDTWNKEDDAPGVTVSTIHGAKGKEWDMVIVIGCEEGILPSAQAIKAAAWDGQDNAEPIEEERRLMFVAMTRARHTLILSWARERTAYFKTTQQAPSRFLEEYR